MNIAVGSNNALKVKGVEDAFRKFFPGDEIHVFPYDVDSHLDKQATCEKDLKRGCETRIRETRKVLEEERADYYVGIESAILISSENISIETIKLVRSDGLESWGLSNGFEVPDELVTSALQTSLKTVMDNEFGVKGGISYLSKGLITPSSLVEYAVIMALAGMNGKVKVAAKQFQDQEYTNQNTCRNISIK